MTKAECKAQLEDGKTLEQIFPFKCGQECMIFKADSFRAGNEILYIPDTWLNDLHEFDDISGDAEMIEEVLSACYTSDDFVEECGGNEELEERLFWYCDWQHPSSAYPEVEAAYEEDTAYERSENR